MRGRSYRNDPVYDLVFGTWKRVCGTNRGTFTFCFVWILAEPLRWSSCSFKDVLLNYEKDKFRFAQASGREETMSTIRDISLAPLGHKRIEWVKDFMPVLSTLRERFVREQPFRGLRISVCVHLEAKTAYLALVLRDGGATFEKEVDADED